MDLANKIINLHRALDHAHIPHAFGGALALAWCTQRARGTIDIDINILVPVEDFEIALKALPKEIRVTTKDRALLQREGQARFWWEKTPVDVFLNSTPFHEKIRQRVRHEQFQGHTIPFLCCTDLATFKAFFNRTRDWADLEDMYQAGTLDIEKVRSILVQHLGKKDERILRLDQLLKT